MTIDINTLFANDILDLYDTRFPAGSILELRTGAPAGADNVAGGTLVAAIELPALPWAAAAARSKSKSIASVWQNVALIDATVGHFRLCNAADAYRDEGTATLAGDGGDAIIDAVDVLAGQVITVETFTRTN